jgi:hypothetical protein
MPTNWIDQVLGHKLINSRDSHSLPTDEELREAYIKAYHFVTVLGNTPRPLETESAKTQPIQEITPDMSKAFDILAKFAKSLNS